MKLVFVCPVTGTELEVESRSWSLWLQFAFAFAQTGSSILSGDFFDAAESGVAALENAYNAYHEKETDEKSFEILRRAPLLMSHEQDQLVEGLRRAGFEDKFAYNPRRGEWVALDVVRAPPGGGDSGMGGGDHAAEASAVEEGEERTSSPPSVMAPTPPPMSSGGEGP